MTTSLHYCWHILILIQFVEKARLWKDDFCAQWWIPVVIAALLFCMVKLSVPTLISHESPFLRVRTKCTTPWYPSTSANLYLWIASQQNLLQRDPACCTSILLVGLVPSPTPSLKGVPMVDPCFNHLTCTGGPCRLPGHAFPQMEAVPGAKRFGTAVNSTSIYFQLQMQDGSSRIRSFSSPIHPQDVNFGSTSSLIVLLKAVYKQPLVLRQSYRVPLYVGKSCLQVQPQETDTALRCSTLFFSCLNSSFHLLSMVKRNHRKLVWDPWSCHILSLYSLAKRANIGSYCHKGDYILQTKKG